MKFEWINTFHFPIVGVPQPIPLEQRKSRCFKFESIINKIINWPALGYSLYYVLLKKNMCVCVCVSSGYKGDIFVGLMGRRSSSGGSQAPYQMINMLAMILQNNFNLMYLFHICFFQSHKRNGTSPSITRDEDITWLFKVTVIINVAQIINQGQSNPIHATKLNWCSISKECVIRVNNYLTHVFKNWGRDLLQLIDILCLP